ncbi:transporter protein smf2 [Colletotrichum sojae]|uniref:Transporter protein smf2 n=1 Tax=Colletotrichum sojae TaxID=2175907 RepID=A0A8H6MVX9_9PEZI|nr:transporter protein smf2 [Colletotrichum sojae]
MNRPSRTDEPYEGEGYNQNPNPLSNDLTTNEDLNGLVNTRALKLDGEHDKSSPDEADISRNDPVGDGRAGKPTATGVVASAKTRRPGRPSGEGAASAPLPFSHSRNSSDPKDLGEDSFLERTKKAIVKFGSFVGPGFMIAVAYIDPGNYATDVAAGATYRFRLLFVVLLANLFAIFLQSLCIKLGTVTGLNLAEACRAFLPRWLNYLLYAFAEIAIIATDIAEVIGFAVGLNLLIPAIPLVAGCAISILDVMVILIFYRPHGSMKGLRYFEYFIIGLVMSVVVCFCIQLSLIEETPVGEVFEGFLPSHALIEAKGLYQACGILGATVMPHSLYLGSGIVQPRLREYDAKHNLMPSGMDRADYGSIDKGYYVPSIKAVKHSLRVSIAELSISLFTFALFVNSAILIVAGVALYGNTDASEADIFSIHELLTASISPAAGTIFALALLLSGISAGVVCTIAGQMVSEGSLNWKMRPWLRRLLTRSISIVPSVVIAGAVGRKGVSQALDASQVVLSVVLPFVTAPLIYFTCRNKYMTIRTGGARFRTVSDDESSPLTTGRAGDDVKMANSWYTAALAVLIWLIMAVMNVANLVLLGRGA